MVGNRHKMWNLVVTKCKGFSLLIISMEQFGKASILSWLMMVRHEKGI